MKIELSAEYLPWANGESGEVQVLVNGQRAFSIPVQFDASPKEPQIEAAVRDFIAGIARANGALSF